MSFGAGAFGSLPWGAGTPAGGASPLVAPVSLVVAPAMDTTRGGAVVAVCPSVACLDTSRDDPLTGPSIGQGWTASGNVQPSAAGMRLAPGAVLASVLTWLSFDLRLSIQVSGSSTGEARFLLAAVSGLVQVQVPLAGRPVVGSATIGGVQARGGGGLVAGTTSVLRLVRAGGHVWTYVDDAVLLERVLFPTDAATLTVIAQGARLTLRDFVVRPGAILGERLVEAASWPGTRRIAGFVPPAPLPGPVDVTAFGLFGEITAPGAFTYIVPPGARVGPGLVEVSDPQVR